MEALCSRPDLLGRLGRHYLTEPASPATGGRSPAVAGRWRRERGRGGARLSLRPLASYRTLLVLLVLYLLGALLSWGPLSSTLLILAAALLRGLVLALLGDTAKTR